MLKISNQIYKREKHRLITGKTIILLLAILLAASLNNSQAQNIWTRKADFGGARRISAVGFSIGTKGYVGTGLGNGDVYLKDFWEYDPVAGTWTQKADFRGTARMKAVGFSIGSKGYIGTGEDGRDKKQDFWQYDPVTNTWQKKADIGGGIRTEAVGFSIGAKGYVGTGIKSFGLSKDFWEYDPAADTWIQKTHFGGTARYEAVGFSIGSKGYLGTGIDVNAFGTKDFWEYDPAADSWTQKADCGETIRYSAGGFNIGSKGYIGIGLGNSTTYVKDFWEYDPIAGTWTQKADFTGTASTEAVGFSIGEKGYLGIGYEEIAGSRQDFWEYSGAVTTCTVPTNLSATNITSSSAKLKWPAVAGAEKYKFRYQIAGTGQWINKTTSGNTNNISSLSPGTRYKWTVQAICQAGSPEIRSDYAPNQEFTTASLSISDEGVQQISFQIYPVPAKDILHIQTNGNTSFSLVNHVGKILVTKNINGSGIINVGGFAAGLYYLKNNSSGAVQKVVIAK